MNKKLLTLLAAASLLAGCGKPEPTPETNVSSQESLPATSQASSASQPTAEPPARRHAAAPQADTPPVIVPRESSPVRTGPPPKMDGKHLETLQAAAVALATQGGTAPADQRNRLMQALARASYAYDAAAVQLRKAPDSRDQVERHLARTGGLAAYQEVMRKAYQAPGKPVNQ